MTHHKAKHVTTTNNVPVLILLIASGYPVGLLLLDGDTLSKFSLSFESALVEKGIERTGEGRTNDNRYLGHNRAHGYNMHEMCIAKSQPSHKRQTELLLQWDRGAYTLAFDR